MVTFSESIPYTGTYAMKEKNPDDRAQAARTRGEKASLEVCEDAKSHTKKSVTGEGGREHKKQTGKVSRAGNAVSGEGIHNDFL